MKSKTEMDPKAIFYGLLLSIAFWLLIFAVWSLAFDRADHTAGPAPSYASRSPHTVEREPAVTLAEIPAEPEQDTFLSGRTASLEVRQEPSPPTFTSETVTSFFKAHPNGPQLFIPRDARSDELLAFEHEAEAIIVAWRAETDRLLALHAGNILSLGADSRATENDRLRQLKMKNLVRSLWPEAKLPE